MDSRDYYKFLGVERNATTEAIQRAFRHMSRKLHPDKVDGNEELMKLLTRIKVTLLDPDKKERYDDTYDPDREAQGDDNEHKLHLHSGSKLSERYVSRIRCWKREFPSIDFRDNCDIIGQKWDELRAKLIEIHVFKPEATTEREGINSEQYYKTLKRLVFELDATSAVQFITSHSTSSAISRIYCELTSGRNIAELPAQLRSILAILKSCSLQQSGQYHQSYECLCDALYTCPNENTMEAIIVLLASGEHNRVLNEKLLLSLFKVDTPGPTGAHQYANRLKSNPMLRALIKYEKCIETQRLTHFEKAMLYIDLCMASADTLQVANNLTLATLYLVRIIDNESTDCPSVYALRNTVCDLCSTVLCVAIKCLDPIALTHYCRLIYNYSTKAHNALANSIARNRNSHTIRGRISKPIVDERQELFYTQINEVLSTRVRVNPLTLISVALSADMLFVNHVNQHFLEKYFNYLIDKHPEHPLNFLFKYYLFEGHWKRWFDQDTVANSRHTCMKSLMEKHQINRTRMDGLLNWPSLTRDKLGWLYYRNMALKLPGRTYARITGLSIDYSMGTYHIHTDANASAPQLICDSDIQEVLENGLSFSIFSLDQANFELDYFPFQKMRYIPTKLANTNYLATLFHADYLLKMLAMDTEICARSPYDFQCAHNNLLSALPDELRQKLRFSDTKDRNYGRAHRFWIEAQPMQASHTTSDDITSDRSHFTFGDCPLMVKEHLLIRDGHGELVDDNDDDDDFADSLFNMSAEKRFAANFTEHYDSVGQHMPIFLRLRELLKLSAILVIIRAVYKRREEMQLSMTIDQEPIRNMLVKLRHQITYPINTEANLQKEYHETLSLNGLSNDSNVAWSEVTRIKGNIRTMLANAEAKMFNDVTESVVKSMEITHCSTLAANIRNWIVYNNESHYECTLVTQLAEKVMSTQMANLSRFGNYLRAHKVDLDASDHPNAIGPDEKVEEWVPAAFSMADQRKCYGGVSLIPNMDQSDGAGGGGDDSGSSGSDSDGSDREGTGILKRLWLFVRTHRFTVRLKDLGTGKSTASNRSLAAKIRKLGKAGDDCGHIQGRQLGGKMTKENLVPQSAKVNRGLYRAQEAIVNAYLSERGSRHAKAEVTVKVYRTRDSLRPTYFSYELELTDHGNKTVVHPHKIYLKN